MTLRRSLLAAGLLVVLGASALVTYALWGKQIDVPVGIVTSGNLDLELVGAPVWADTSPDVTAPGAIGVLADNRAVRLATPGDTYTFTQAFRTELEGDNMAARLTVDWDQDPVLDPTGRVTASYTVTLPGGTPSADTPLGAAVTLPGAPDNLTPAEVVAWGPGATWQLTVTLVYAGADEMVEPVDIPTANPLTDLGTIEIALDQVRDGEGFVP